MSAETWRVVCEGGEVLEVEVNDRGEGNPLRYAADFYADGVRCHAPGVTPRRALVNAADMMGWDVTEIVAPGAQTSEERLAQAVEAQRAQCGWYMCGRACKPGEPSRFATADEMRAERDAAVAQRDALAGAAAKYVESVDAFDEDAYEDTVGAIDRDRKRLDAALVATPVAMVRAEVVREYLDADREWQRSRVRFAECIDAAAVERTEELREARLEKLTSLDAALAAAGGV